MFITTAQVQNVIIERIHDMIVLVKWDPVSGIPTDGFSYVVIYGPVPNGQGQSEMMETVSGDETEAVIRGLKPNVMYQFQVVVSVEVNGEVLTGERSEVNDEKHHQGTSLRSACTLVIIV